jgi:hypothetical protein
MQGHYDIEFMFCEYRKNINTIAIKYAMSILLHKRRIENHQPLPQTLDPHRQNH